MAPIAAPPSSAAFCERCSLPSTRRCSACKAAWYCSEDCQRADWQSGHRARCAAELPCQPAAPQPAGPGPVLGPVPKEAKPVPPLELQPYALIAALARGAPAGSAAPPPPPLPNCGNSCYAASVLQCMLASRPLAALLLRREHGCSAQRCALCALQRLAAAWHGSSGGSALDLGPLLTAVGHTTSASLFDSGEQEDSHEFAVQLLDACQRALLSDGAAALARPADALPLRAQEATAIGHLFGGYFVNATTCRGCGGTSCSFSALLGLEVQLPPSGCSSVEGALANFSAQEQLAGENRYSCDRCRRKVEATRQTCLEVAPNLLQLCLKRYTAGLFGKLTKHVSFSERLDLSPYMAADALDTGAPLTYTLYGVVQHLDAGRRTDFGHYVSYVRGRGGDWYRCDDAVISQVPLSSVLACGAYMLFYQRDAPRASIPDLAARIPGRGHAANGLRAASAANGRTASAANGGGNAGGLSEDGTRTSSSSSSSSSSDNEEGGSGSMAGSSSGRVVPSGGSQNGENSGDPGMRGDGGSAAVRHHHAGGRCIVWVDLQGMHVGDEQPLWVGVERGRVVVEQQAPGESSPAFGPGAAASRVLVCTSRLPPGFSGRPLLAVRHYRRKRRLKLLFAPDDA